MIANSGSFLSNNYYHIRRFIPRRLQIKLRRWVVLKKRRSFSEVWPVDEKAGRSPKVWSGWPDQKRFALVLTHDVETSRGMEKCYPLARLEEGLVFKSSFNFVPEGYNVSIELRDYLTRHGFEVGVHGLTHRGNLFQSKKVFEKKVCRINHFLKEWKSVGFRSPCMFHNLDWIHEINVAYDASTFDVDPFEPQPDGVGTIFPSWASGRESGKGYVELPYTLPQDFTLFVLMREKNSNIWKEKLDWIVGKGGMALLITHPDYMNFGGKRLHYGEYPVEYYKEFLGYIKSTYEGQYWHVLPKDLVRFWSETFAKV